MADTDKPEPNTNDPSADPGSGKAGWLDGLAKRSTGLPGDVMKGDEKNTPKGAKSPWSYAGIGIQFAGTVALFTYMGFKLDQWMGWSPWGMVTLAMIALIGNFYLLIKESLQNEKQERKK